ncbi:hypothetical protein SBOR_6485 [Sclerotinia borealis F-4128]|uniref:BTB domain-containing protein n=1 Tax=Sclerotinia borealis (strain F-4128) TaxID=1432307 RepID=W9CBA8_SCLBF|nr:hypothetical protein SBOR_6485 [Sclerotinia borealis F-4128]
MTSNVKYDLEDFSKVFTIVIGSDKDERRVKVSVALLSAQSFYFKGACAEKWLGVDKILEFPHERPETFEIFTAWLNAGDIKHASSLQKTEESDDDQTRARKLSKRWKQLLNCYIMADYIQAPKYMNTIMNALVATLKDFEGQPTETNELAPLCDSCAETIDIIWDKTLVRSPLRKLVLDTLNSTRHAPWFMAQIHYFDNSNPPDGPNLTVPQEFILEFLEQSLRKLQTHDYNGFPWYQDHDFYHVMEKLP